MEGLDHGRTEPMPASSNIEDEYNAYIRIYGTLPPPGWRPDHVVPHDFDRPDWMRKMETQQKNISTEPVPLGRKVGRRYTRGLVASILIVVPILFLALALVTKGWYSIETETGAERADCCIEFKDNYGNEQSFYIEHFSMDLKWDLDYGLTKMDGRTDMNIQAKDTTYGIDIEQDDELDFSSSKLEEEKNEATLTLVGGIIAILAMFAFIPLGLLAYFNKIPGFVPLAFMMATAILLISVLVYFTVSFPGEVKKDQEEFDEVLKEDFGLGNEINSMFQELFKGVFDKGSFGWSYYLAWVTVPLLIGIGCMFIGVKKDVKGFMTDTEKIGNQVVTLEQGHQIEPVGDGIRYHYRI